ncbi:MAG TPA: tyrosine-type recombinase/integrase [Acidimicrobiales bacterium]|nr:tyrosine-type recombinase/integrase [Acidimicrobiales bacterium]
MPEKALLQKTIEAYLAQIAVSLRPRSVEANAQHLGAFVVHMAEHHPEIAGAGGVARRHIESYKLALAERGYSASTLRSRLGMLRMFFERIIEWGWDDAPARVPLFAGDVPKRDEALPKFLDDADFARFMRALADEPLPLTRLAIELLARTGMRVSELCDLEADAVVVIGAGHWLRIPVGKLHNDRFIPLHPHLVALIDEWSADHDDAGTGRLLTKQGRPLRRDIVARMLDRVARRAGIGHVHPHRLRHTLATQAINRGMSLEAVAALLGHRSLDMTMIYARIADRTVAEEYFNVAAKVDALYGKPAQLPAADEGPAMARLRREHHRMLGNGYCTRPVELDCAFESICERCSYFATTVEFKPTLRRQRNDARRKSQTGREELFTTLLAGIDSEKSADTP